MIEVIENQIDPAMSIVMIYAALRQVMIVHREEHESVIHTIEELILNQLEC